ncbi:hypothetical protein C1I99_15665 [Micromonospora deserti]|uniref:Uncharacterized protein n=1 Tax=Micromonospora deserti TaxID=2070366 RepID=A0A2W2CHM7_9ACTN|nr:hypothetical protein C1I99_15665 [Micromonospora deserti]
MLPMPGFGDLFTDIRGGDRTMRISWHPERGALVLSLWAGTVCRGSFRMAADDLDNLLALLDEITSTLRPAVGAASGGSAPTGPQPTVTARAEWTPGAAGPGVERAGEAHRLRLPVPRVA